MITGFEVGAIFKIIDQASPALRQILKQVRDLDAAIKKARENLALMSGSLVPNGMARAIAETDKLATSWGRVAQASAAATRSLGQASSAARIAAPGGGGGGGRHRPGWLGGGGGGSSPHFSGPGVVIPGGGHFRTGGGAMAGAGLLGYGVYEAAEMEKYVWQLAYHAGLDTKDDATKSKFRKILQDSMRETGFGLTETAKAALQEVRMFKGTPGSGVDVLPEMLSAAGKEAIAKDESPVESMKALIGLAHMTKQYDPESIKKLAPMFAFLSTANPGSLSSIERAAGYAVPLMQSGLEIDPSTSLLLGTALTRAGATNTKSGTWLREMAIRAMPGTSMMSKMAFKKHEDALRKVGLVDENGQPTWFTDGKPDIMKMLEIAGPNAAKLPIAERAGVERGLFGAQGGGAFALLADPAVNEQIKALRAEMNSPEFKNRYNSFFPDYEKGSTVQNARTGMADFNNLMADIGQHVLPPLNNALRDFKSVLEGLRNLLPGTKSEGDDKWKVGTRALEGAGVGAALGLGIGAFGGPVGAVGGAIVGGAAGGLYGLTEGLVNTYSKTVPIVDDFGREIGTTTNSVKGFGDAIKGLGAPARDGVFPGGAQKMSFLQGPSKGATPQPLSLSLNIDGRTLAQTVAEIQSNLYEFPGSAPSPNGLTAWNDGDHNFATT